MALISLHVYIQSSLSSFLVHYILETGICIHVVRGPILGISDCKFFYSYTVLRLASIVYDPHLTWLHCVLLAVVSYTIRLLVILIQLFQ